MEIENRPKKRQVHYDRVTLNKSSIERLNSWTEQAKNQVEGIKLTRTDLVNWLIDSHKEVLSSAELGVLEQNYFDQAALGVWAIKKLKEALARGEQVRLIDILNGRRSNKTASKTPSDLPKQKKVSKPTAPSEPPAANASTSSSDSGGRNSSLKSAL